MRKLFIAAVLLVACSRVTWAQGPINSETIYWENDNFGIGRKSDRFYTNGAKVIVGLTQSPKWLHLADRRDAFCNHFYCGDSKARDSAALVFGQNFYTPEIITIAAPQPDDRPWAGVLYSGLSVSISDDAQTIQHMFEVQVGVLGQGAGAQATQKYIHNDLGFSNKDPQGWHNQLRNDPALNLLYKRSRRYDFRGAKTLDVVWDAGGMLGTVQTFLNTGATLRLGRHISGFPVATIPGTAVPGEKPHKWEAYVFVGRDGRWIPFNATLDGGLFNDGPKANGPKRFVTDFRRGFSARYRWVRLTYSVIDRSKEFDVPPGHLSSARFGSVALTFEPFTDFE